MSEYNHIKEDKEKKTPLLKTQEMKENLLWIT